MKALNPWYINVLLIILTVATVCVFLLFRNRTYYDFLVWNLFLAWIPYAVSLFAYYIHTWKAALFRHALLLILGVIWLLFLPNAPYLITDLLHLTLLKDSYIQRGVVSFKYWYDFFVIFLFIWNGLLLGCSSMYLFHYIWIKTFNRFSSWLFITAVAFLSGYGILLGRTYRLNSWDVWMNSKFLDVIQKSLNLQAFRLCLLLGFVIMAMYITFYLLINGTGISNKNAPASSSDE